TCLPCSDGSCCKLNDRTLDCREPISERSLTDSWSRGSIHDTRQKSRFPKPTVRIADRACATSVTLRVENRGRWMIALRPTSPLETEEAPTEHNRRNQQSQKANSIES